MQITDYSMQRDDDRTERSEKCIWVIISLLAILIIIGLYSNFHKSQKVSLTNAGNNFDKNRILDDLVNIPVGENPTAEAYDSKKGTINMLDKSGGEVTVIDESSNKVVARVNTGF